MASADGDEMTSGMGGAAGEQEPEEATKPKKPSGSAGSENTEEEPEEQGTGGVASEPVEDPEPEGDDEAPAILLTVPADGDAGIEADSLIEIEFSEAMDPASVEAAYASSDLPLTEVTFGWNEDNTKLTITPNHGLSYVDGKVLEETAPRSYTISIGGSAADAAGNAMGDDAEWSFTTLRRMFASLQPIPQLTGYVYIDGISHSTTIQAGDAKDNSGFRGLISFDLSAVPEDHELLTAKLVARQLAPTATPFDDLSFDADPAELSLFTRSFASRLAAASSVIALPVGVFSASAEAGPRSLSVLGPVKAHLADREQYANRSQYVLQFPKQTDNEGDVDRVTFAEAALELSYMTP